MYLLMAVLWEGCSLSFLLMLFPRLLKTSEHCVQTTGKLLHYKGSRFHRIIKGFMAQGGNFSRRDRSGGESIYGGKFPDENFKLHHDGPGLLSMAHACSDGNGSQFITFKAASHLDGKHVVFGKLIVGQDTLEKIEQVEVDDTKPVVPVKIVDCGELHDTKYHGMVVPVPENGKLALYKKKSSKSKSGKIIFCDSYDHEARERDDIKNLLKAEEKRIEEDIIHPNQIAHQIQTLNLQRPKVIHHYHRHAHLMAVAQVMIGLGRRGNILRGVNTSVEKRKRIGSVRKGAEGMIENPDAN